MNVGGEIVKTKLAVKYLGIMIDRKLNFSKQIRYKAAKVIAALSRLMVNVGGPVSSEQQLLMNSVQSILLYRGEVWTLSTKRPTEDDCPRCKEEITKVH